MIQFRFAAAILLWAAVSSLGFGRSRPAPSNDFGQYTAVSGPISQLNYGPELELTGFLIGQDTLVTFPSYVGYTIAAALQVGHTVKAEGYAASLENGVKRLTPLDLENLTTGKSFTIPLPGEISVFAGSGTVAQFNFDERGEANGFVLNTGVFARTPHGLSAKLQSLLHTGSAVAISGLGHKTVTGRTVVDVQAINGQPVNSMIPPPLGAPLALEER